MATRSRESRVIVQLSPMANEGKQSTVHLTRRVEVGGVSEFECVLNGKSKRLLVIYIRRQDLHERVV